MPPDPPPTITYALVYTRVSSSEQAEGLSLDRQLLACRQYAAHHGWMLAGEYQDVLSGQRDDRPAYQALLADVRQRRRERQAVAVVVLRLDRLGRRVLERVRCREELKALGVPTHSVADNGEVSDLTANIMASVAQEEVRQLAERVQGMRRHLRAAGWYPPGRTPWGYQWRPATADERAQGAPRSVLEPHSVEAPYVVTVFRRVAAGESVRAVARWVALLPSDARGGRALDYPLIRRLLRAPVYVGQHVNGTPGRWPPLVEPALWAQVQWQLAQHVQQPRQASRRYLLTGLARCPRCGARMVGWHSPSPQRRHRPRYRCVCGYSLPTARADPAVLDAVRGLLARLPVTYPELRRILRQQARTPPVPDLRAQHERVIAQAQERLRRAALQYVDGVLGQTAYALVRDQVQADLDAAASALAASAPVTRPPPLPALLGQAKSWERIMLDGTVADQRLVLPLFVARVVLSQPPEIAWTPLGAQLAALGAV